MSRTQISLFIFLVFSLIACQRKTDDVAKISLSLPDNMSIDSNGKASSQALADLLIPQHVIINVAGDGVKEKIVYTWDRCSDCPEGEKTFLSAFPVGEAETGKNLLIQVVAVYKNKDSGVLRFFYGNLSTVFSASDVVVNLGIVGSATNPVQGRVAGRYLNGIDTGPTGTLEMSYDFNEDDSFPAMTIETTSIINGWFTIFGLTGMAFKYTVLETGEVLWGKSVALDSDTFNPSYTPDAGTTYPQYNRVIKAYIPVHLEYHSNSDYVRDPQIFTWGYWGTAASNISNKRACTQSIDGYTTSKAKSYVVSEIYASSTALTISRYTNAGSVVPTISELQDDSSDANAYKNIVVDGGFNMASVCSDLNYSTPDKFLNYFKVEMDFIDGVGNDEAAGFKGIFKNQYVSGRYTPVSVSGDPSEFSFALLPGVDQVISDIAVYSKLSTMDYRIDNPKCDGLEGILMPNLTGTGSVIVGTDTVNVGTPLTASNIISGVYGVVCYKTRSGGKKMGTVLRRQDIYSAPP